MKLTVPAAVARVEAALCAPDGPFATEEAPVLGERMPVFRRRPRSLRDLLAAGAAWGDAEYARFVTPQGEFALSFGEHARAACATAAVLRDRFGVGPGDRVAILGRNSADWLLTFWASVSLGAIAVGLNAWWTPVEIGWALEDARPRLLCGETSRLERLGAIPRMPVIAMETELRALRRTRDGAALPDHAINEDDPAVMLYTSGTTGRPKGALHSHRNLLALVGLHFFHGARLRMLREQAAAAGNGEPAPFARPCVLVTSPLFHVSGLHSAAVTGLAAGSRLIFPTGRFDAGAVLALIEREQVTAWGYTSALLHRLVHHPEVARRNLTSLVQLGGGGSPIAPALQAAARTAVPSAADWLGVGYGSTECTALATLNFGPELAAHPGSVGRPLPTVALEIRDPDGRRLPEGAEGEVCVRSPLVMLGYFGNPAATAAALGPGRWLRTGDLGCLEQGRLYLSARRQDLILRGGENVYPVEIEQRLELHPDVAEAAVLGVPHEELGQEVKAVVVPRPGAALEPVALASWVAAALAYFKVPAHWEIRPEPLPRNAVGKVVKHALTGGKRVDRDD